MKIVQYKCAAEDIAASDVNIEVVEHYIHFRQLINMGSDIIPEI